MARAIKNFLAGVWRVLEQAPLRRRRWAGLIGVYLACYFLLDAEVLCRTYLCSPLNNLNVWEAESWAAGRLDLDAGTGLGQRPWDSAVLDGRVYNVFPPLFTLIAVPFLVYGVPGVPSYMLLLLLAAPIPGLTYALFLRRTERVRMAVVFSLCYLLGTSMLPVLTDALRSGVVYRLNHALSQLGLLIFLLEYFGRRRVWVCGIGVIIAAWSRQLTVVYLFPVAYLALRQGGTAPRWTRVVSFVAVTAVVAAVPLTLNALKFGNPLDSGYGYIYVGRDPSDDPLARDAQQGLFSPVFVPGNLYYMNLGFPLPDWQGWVLRFAPNNKGTGIWWTTPLLLFMMTDWRRMWQRRDVRYLLAAAGGIFAILMLYHTTGYTQIGYNRFSLDFLIVLLASVAPHCDRPGRRWLCFGFMLWSVWYFRWAI